MRTPYLYDDGEENWMHKYHLGCGGVYLADYTNCDIEGISALEHPDLVQQNMTTIQDYYAGLDGSMCALPKRRQTVYDVCSDATRFADMPQMIDKIVAIQLFEHFTPASAIKTLGRWYSNLRRGGVLVMSVPDMTGTLELIERGNGSTEFALRHLRGRMGDKHNTHQAWYTKETLTELLGTMGFSSINELPNMHFYPAITVKAIK